ncbi:hypothetical protein D3C73_1015640 [compost metagenome]
MGHAHDRQYMVFAKADEPDIPENNQLVIPADLLEGPLQIGARVALVALEQLLVAARDARWRIEQAFPIRIVSGPFYQGANGRFSLLAFGCVGLPHGRPPMRRIRARALKIFKNRHRDCPSSRVNTPPVTALDLVERR